MLDKDVLSCARAVLAMMACARARGMYVCSCSWCARSGAVFVICTCARARSVRAYSCPWCARDGGDGGVLA